MDQEGDARSLRHFWRDYRCSDWSLHCEVMERHMKQCPGCVKSTKTSERIETKDNKSWLITSSVLSVGTTTI